jgi:protein arginine kinase activator
MIEGKMHKLDLCEKCAKEMDVSSTSGFSLADLLLNIESERKLPENFDEKVCPNCGFSRNDLKNTGRLGCQHCYEVFTDVLKSVYNEFQKSDRHRGKMPSKPLESAARVEQLTNLTRDLDSAISDEKFEEAAWIRDQIKTLKSG